MSGGTGLALPVETLGGEFRAWVRRLEKLGGCAAPVMLMGHTITRDAASGAVLHVFRSADLPYGLLMVPCRNRREALCLPCSLLHNGDSFQIVRSGLIGGKGVPAEVATHPRLFVTVTAPSFGPVHRVGSGGVCHPVRGESACPHGRASACWSRHVQADPLLGSPLCVGCYDYAGAVMWNAASGLLWVQYVNRLYREVARLGGLPISTGEVRRLLRLSYVKVTEFQRRGSVHFHVVIRADGPGGAGDPAPAWVGTSVLVEAAKAAGRRTSVGVPDLGGDVRLIGLGAQLDTREIGAADGLNDDQVASYLAKYVTKDDGYGLVLPRRLLVRAGIDLAPPGALSGHARTLMRTAWDLGAVAELAGLRLRPWAHQLGFRGNVITKSRAYSTTYGELRAARARHGREAAGLIEPDPGSTVVEKHWRFVAAGLSPQLGEIAAGIADATAARKGRLPDWIDTGAGDAT